MWRIGVDTGGTFTDFVISDEKSLFIKKIPSTPANPWKAVMDGVWDYTEFSPTIVHGTTVATNAFLENKTARTALIVTKGFEHVLHIGRQNRSNLFSLKPEKPDPLIPLSLSFGIDERTLFDGRIEKPLKRNELLRIAKILKREKVSCVAILFLHSYANPENEMIAEEILKGMNFKVTSSHSILSEYREYERGVITALNASLIPVLGEYLEKLKKGISGSKLFIMQSQGGFISPEIAREKPVFTLLSGPAGGAIASLYIGKLIGMSKFITLDMGGTSTDVSLIDGGFKITKENSLKGIPLRIPMIDIQTVGAGGGSITRIDRGGVIKVGPESAGADPGPACYGVSDLATVTDAFMVLGWMVPEHFLGGKMKIYPDKSFKAIEGIAKKIRLNVYQCAEGIVQVALVSMEKALRVVSIERGYDPRDFSLFAFGGAGGLVAVNLAERLGISTVMVPNLQGVFSALGMMLSDSSKELSSSVMKKAHERIKEELDKRFEELEREALELFRIEKLEEERILFSRSLDMRYKGQSYELNIPYKNGFLKEFHRAHMKLYSHYYKEREVEIVNLRLRGVGIVDKVELPSSEPIQSSSEDAFYCEKEIYYEGDFMKTTVYLRERLLPGNILKGPAIISSYDGTTFVPLGYKCNVDKYYNLIIRKENV